MAETQEHSDSPTYDYDIFLSLSNRDSSFINHLDRALLFAGFRVFKDGDPIPGSTDIKSEMKKKIDQSKTAVIVLTKNYVSSRWYLDQLLMIIEAKKYMILPVYDGIYPGRAVEALERFEDQLKVQTDSQMRKNLMEKIENWNVALSFAADLDGFVLQNLEDESMLIKEIIGAVEEKVKAVKEGFAQMETETEDELLNQEESLSLVQDWSGVEINLMNIEELPENPNCPFLVKLFFQNSNDLSEIPYSFFESMPLLQVLDLSNTSIKTLPPSIASLVELREFFLRDCLLLTELPVEIGELKNLEVFDLERTELICLPKEIGGLLKLECLKLSMHKYADKYSQRKGIETIIPRATLTKFSCLKELSILVDPDCDWWDKEVEAVIIDLPQLQNLQVLKLFFPTPDLLHKFLRLGQSIYQNLSNFTLIIGRHEQHIISSLPDYFHRFFEKLGKCLIYVNGKGNTDVIGDALEHARTLFLDRQWTMEKLSDIKTDGKCLLNSCLVVECNEMSTIVDSNDFYQEGNISGKPIFGSLRHLSLHYMKNLQSIWRGPIVSPCFSCLEILTFHTCPMLTTIFNLTLLPTLKNLKELMVENCSIVKILITVDTFQVETDSYFLPALKKILLADLPELESISGGIRIGPKLESIISSNCPMLKNLSPTNEGATGESLLDIHSNVKGSLYKATEEISRHIPNMKVVISDDFKGISPQYLSSSMEPLLRRMVREEMEQYKQSLTSSASLQKQSQKPPTLKLAFTQNPPPLIYTGTKILDLNQHPLQILVVDPRTDQIVPNINGIVEIVVLNGDFPRRDSNVFTSEEFNSNILWERIGKRPLLTGNLYLTMREGFASVGDLEFTDNSSWIRSGKFRLGARIVQGKSSGQDLKIKQATTQPFVVKDHRGELYKKHHPPMLEDEVWRLEKIAKDGAFNKKLHRQGIHTVQDFLKLSVVYPSKLRAILGSFSEKRFKQTLDHARTCVVGTKLYSFRGPNYHIVLNPICQVVKVVINGKTYTNLDLDSMINKVYIDKLVEEAYCNWSSLEEIDGLLDQSPPIIQLDPYYGGSTITTNQEYAGDSTEEGNKSNPYYGGSTIPTSQEHSGVSMEVGNKTKYKSLCWSSVTTSHDMPVETESNPNYGGSTITTGQEHSGVSVEVGNKSNQQHDESID